MLPSVFLAPSRLFPPRAFWYVVYTLQSMKSQTLAVLHPHVVLQEDFPHQTRESV